MPTARRGSSAIVRACCCRASARASSRWRRVSIRPNYPACTRHSTTSSPPRHGAMKPCSPPSVSRCCRPSPDMARSPPGSSTTPAFPRRASTRSVWRANIAGSWASRRTAVSLSIANDRASLPIAIELYLPEDWAGDPARRAKAGVPEDLAFRTKPQIALAQIRRALEDGVPPGIILGDAGYGIDTDFRTAVSELALVYVLGVQPSLGVWPPGCGPLPPKPWSGKGRPPKLWRRDAGRQPITAKDLASALPPSAWQTVSWREGSRGELAGRFAAVRVRPSHRDYWRAEPHAEEWLLIEWPEGKKEPSKYWLSTLPARTSLGDLVGTAKLRWLIERDYQELKQELGLDHFEGRGWRGFHHHATLCIAAYGFLVRERSLFPPEVRFQRPPVALPTGW